MIKGMDNTGNKELVDDDIHSTIYDDAYEVKYIIFPWFVGFRIS